MSLLKQYAHDYKINPQIGTVKIVKVVLTYATDASPEVVRELKFLLMFF
jgi:hypothetical protein